MEAHTPMKWTDGDTPMKKAIILAISLLLTAGLAACSSGPKEFKSEAGRFSVMAAVELQETTQAVETQGGKMDLHIFMGQEGRTGYFVSYNDHPQELVQQAGPEKMLDGARDGAVGNINGNLASEIRISLEGHPGRELVIDGTGEDGRGLTIRGRLFMAKNRLYQVMAVTPRAQANTKEIDDFLQSFKLLGG
jgi:hypothetical protein